jgi:hypothetical protein
MQNVPCKVNFRVTSQVHYVAYCQLTKLTNVVMIMGYFTVYTSAFAIASSVSSLPIPGSSGTS